MSHLPTTSRLPDAYFERVYAQGVDPWGFATRWYETRKYALTLAALPKPRYARAFEPGCAIGVLTEGLAQRCDALVAGELMPAIAEHARTRVAAHAHVDVRVLALPDDYPEGRFDLVVLSEVAYYLTEPGLDQLLSRIDASLEVGGHVVAVHWTGPTDYPQTGHAVHARFDAHPQWTRLVRHEEAEFVLAVYERR